MFDLNGKIAVVTGAASGLGREAAIAYAECGAKVALLSRRFEKLQEVVKEIEPSGGEAAAFKCDVRSNEQVKHAVDQVVEKFGTVLYFSSDASSYVTGQFVVVDGGISLI